MPNLCLYFQVHQPIRLKPYTFFDIGRDPFYEADDLNRDILNKVSDKCYIPATRLLLKLIRRHPEFRIAFSLSGVFIEQAEHHRPDVITLFQELVATGNVELLAETYYHSLCFRHSGKEFARQVTLHDQKLKDVFHIERPRVFRHTELIYFNELAHFVEGLGYDGMMAEGVPSLLEERSPNGVYSAPNVTHLKTLTRNCRLSDDIAFRFGNPHWDDHPLTAEKYARWVASEPGEVANVFIDYETIGEHKWTETGIFDFWEELPDAMAKEGVPFVTPSEVVDTCNSLGIYDAHAPTSWADTAKDLSAWNGNQMQTEAIRKILKLETKVKAIGNPDLLHQWSKMQTSDHFYYMCTKGDADGDVHSYFNPYSSPYDGYMFFMNSLSDLQVRVDHLTQAKLKSSSGFDLETKV
ncbi:MAG: alpha-amylase [Verrucomicrobiales bacterium]|jgi:alpha-amylase